MKPVVMRVFSRLYQRRRQCSRARRRPYHRRSYGLVQGEKETTARGGDVPRIAA